MFASKDTLLTRPSGYNIARSVRLRQSASAYLNRTPVSSGSQTTFTHSIWLKRGLLSSSNYVTIYGSESSGSNYVNCAFYQDNLYWTTYNGTTNITMQTTQVFRDVSAWYHLVIAVDTTQATAANRVKLYVNGTQITAGTFNYPSQNQALQINTSSYVHKLGFSSGFGQYFDGYLTEINFVDGQALTPSSFGSTNSITGVWQPAKYTGTYGTNGFYLNFSDNSSNTATTIGKDYSGNGNNWTPNNISVTTGSTYDSMVDVPTLTSATAANYAVWNPLDKGTVTVTDGNLAAVSGADTHAIRASMGLPLSGKFYWEITVSGLGYGSALGIASATSVLTTGPSSAATRTYQWGSWFNTYNSGVVQYGTNQSITGGTNWSGASQLAAGDVLMIAVDMDNGSMWVGKNNAWFNSSGTANPATNTDPRWTGLGGTTWFAYYSSYGSTSPPTVNINFGQQGFKYTPPTGFVALNTYNLPDSTIKNGAGYMAATLYNGTGATQSISNSNNGVSFQPDFVWLKSRTNAASHRLTDSVRGVNKQLMTNTTEAEATFTTMLTAFNSDGFTLGDNAGINGSGYTNVGWQWKAGGTSSSNTNGSITSTVSVGATQGFSVVTYTGTGANATVGHGLGVAPQMIIVKCRSNASTNWTVYHTSLGNTGYIYLNLTNAAGTGYSGFWNSTSPTSSVFSLGSDVDGYVNGSGRTNVAYCVASVAGFSSVGSYTGNGSTDGPFIYLGFKPRWFMSKRSDTAGNDWVIMDTSRDTYNASQKQLYADLSTAEEVNSVYDRDFLSNGIKIRTSTASANASGSTYIYVAFAENPFRNALAR